MSRRLGPFHQVRDTRSPRWPICAAIACSVWHARWARHRVAIEVSRRSQSCSVIAWRFLPTDADVAAARELLAALDAAARDGQGVAVLPREAEPRRAASSSSRSEHKRPDARCYRTVGAIFVSGPLPTVLRTRQFSHAVERTRVGGLGLGSGSHGVQGRRACRCARARRRRRRVLAGSDERQWGVCHARGRVLDRRRGEPRSRADGSSR